MALTLTLTGDSLADVLAQLLGAARQIEKIEGQAIVPAAVDDTAPEPAPAELPPAPAPTPAAQAPEPEALRVAIRTILTPLMRTDKAAAARELVKRYSDKGVSHVDADRLAALHEEARELAK